MNQTAICTIISQNYLAQARSLYESLASFHPETPFYVLLADQLDGSFNPKNEPFQIIMLEELKIPQLSEMSFQYSIIEFNTFLKPFLFQFLFNNRSEKSAIYLDPDIIIHNKLNHSFDLLSSHTCVLTPHLLGVQSERIEPIGHQLLQCGTYNLGFIGIRNDQTAKRFLQWWGSRLFSTCYSATSEGFFVDQKWLDLAFGLFDGFFVLRNPGYNAAYWNLRQRHLTDDRKGHYHVLGTPLIFFHFSGYDINRPQHISKYDPELRTNFSSTISKLFSDYHKTLIRHNAQEVSHWQYAFERYDNGEIISPLSRKAYAIATSLLDMNFPNPFLTKPENSFYHRFVRPNLNKINQEKPWPIRLLEAHKKSSMDQLLVHASSFLNRHEVPSSSQKSDQFMTQLITALQFSEQQIDDLKTENADLNRKLNRIRKIPGYMMASRLMNKINI